MREMRPRSVLATLMLVGSLFVPGLLLLLTTYAFFNGRPLTLFLGLGLVWIAVIASVAILVLRLTTRR